jgi:hypothetical protein
MWKLKIQKYYVLNMPAVAVDHDDVVGVMNICCLIWIVVGTN